jgi:hypothetical protein
LMTMTALMDLVGRPNAHTFKSHSKQALSKSRDYLDGLSLFKGCAQYLSE